MLVEEVFCEAFIIPPVALEAEDVRTDLRVHSLSKKFGCKI